MRLIVHIVLLSLLLCLPARAQDVEINVGPALVCDTQQQAEQFLAVYQGDAPRAVARVNTEANTPDACVIAGFAYVLGPKVAIRRTDTTTFHVVQVLVLAVFVDGNLHVIQPAVFFSVAEGDEQPT